MHSKIVLIGKAAAGKDYLRKRFIERNFKYGVSCTTRPPRIKDGEVHGKDYFFISEEEFLSLIESGEMIEYQQFNGWYYGLTRDEFENCDVMILNREAVDMLPEDIRQRCFVIYLDINQEIRLARILQRNDPDDPASRRTQADEEQYKNFNNYDLRVTNHDF